MSTRPIAPGLWQVDSDGQPMLLGSECTSCGEILFPRRGKGACIRCQGTSLRDVSLRREGTVVASTVVNQPPAGGYYRGPVPYAYGVVVLDDGVRILAQVEVTVPPLPPGTRVRLLVDTLSRSDADEQVQAFRFVRSTP